MGKIIGGTATSNMLIPDWNQTNPNRADYIKNKPAIVQTTGDSETAVMSQKAVSDTNFNATRIKQLVCTLGNGSAGNSGNTSAVNTADYIEVQPNKYVKLLVNKELEEEGHFYTYGFSVYDENKNKILEVDENNWAIVPVYKIPNDTNCKYVRFSLFHKDSNGDPTSLRITDFSEGDVVALVEYENDFDFAKNGKGLTWEDYSNVFDGYVIENQALDDNTGEAISANYACVTDYIPVLKGRYYHDIGGGYIWANGYGFMKVAFYDKNKNFLRVWNYNKPNDTSYTDTSPVGTTYRVRASEDGYARFQCNKEHYDSERMCIIEAHHGVVTMGDMPEYTKNYNVHHKRLKQISDEWDSVRDATESIESVFADDLNKVYSSAKYGYNAAGVFNKNKRFAMLVTTDIHASTAELEKAVNILNDNAVFDCGVCLGDIQGSSYSDNNGTWYTNLVNKSEKPFYTVLGNHDTVNYYDPPLGGTPAQAFEKFIQPTLGVMGMPNLTTPYYYKQFDDYKISIIFLNNYDAPTDKDESGNYKIIRAAEALSQTQVDWFINALKSVPTDYHLIVARHSYPGENQLIDIEWSQNGSFAGDRIVYDDNDIVADIVNAWINGTTINKSYAPKTEFALCPTLTAVADFSARGTGDFIVHLVGHTHKDLICKSTNYENQKIIGFCATAFDGWQNEDLDLPRVEGTKTQTAITAFTYDTTTRTIRLVRIGSNLTFDLKKREYVTITV